MKTKESKPIFIWHEPIIYYFFKKHIISKEKSFLNAYRAELITFIYIFIPFFILDFLSVREYPFFIAPIDLGFFTPGRIKKGAMPLIETKKIVDKGQVFPEG